MFEKLDHLPYLSTWSKIDQFGIVFFRQEVLCDVVLVAGSTELSCHKVVLCSCSQYFYAMFTGELSESKSDRITLQEMDPEALLLLIDFVYTSEIHVTEENVQVSVSNVLPGMLSSNVLIFCRSRSAGDVGSFNYQWSICQASLDRNKDLGQS